jgi:sterol desaturase/sphingolipid hydroxylase (fatty acid hydroxylase superfamily)
MDTTYTKAVGLAVPVFISLILIELLFNRIRHKHSYHFADSINSLSCGILSTGTQVFVGFFRLLIYQWVSTHIAPFHLPGNHIGTWIYTFLLYDLCFYWKHRCEHSMGIFWASHVVHHQSEEFNLTTALRQTSTDWPLGFIFYLPLALTGVPLHVFLIIGIIQLFYQFWPHTRLIDKMGVLDRLVQTPSNHRAHHAQNDLYVDKNYVGVLLIWDHLFGSYQEERANEPCIFGIRGQLKSWNPLWANLHYYYGMAKDSYYTASFMDKLRVWFARPGWRPADVAARFPKAPYDVHRDFAKYDPPRNLAISIYGLLQFLIILLANSHFLSIWSHESFRLNLAYFLFIGTGLVCVGGLFEQRRPFLFLELARLLLTAACVLRFGSWFGGLHDPRLIAAVVSFAAVSALALLFIWRKRQSQGLVQRQSSVASIQ